MKKYLIIAASLMAVMPLAAQETYENAKIVTGDLNGTARYVGMGGAMEALGADLSTISTNPAGIGLFRHSQANVSFGVVSQQDGKDFADDNKTNMSFDQIGFVYSKKSNSNSYLNLAFNYHKSTNFNHILSAADNLSNASQNKLSYQKLRNDYLYEFKTDGTPNYSAPYITCSQLDDLYARNLFYVAGDGYAYNYVATDYMLNRAHTGYIGEYDFNISGNINDRIYLGVTFGFHDVHYKHYGEYTEAFVSNPENFGGIYVEDSREITGSGFDIKAGVIVRPIESSPFRIGLSVASPTWYDLKTTNYTVLTDGSARPYNTEVYDFKLYTPWKFGLSLGHTVRNYLALGASYEYADYGSTDSRVNDGDYYDYWYDTYYSSSSSDKAMNNHTKQTLKGVSTLKVGLEYKPIADLALRLGYNYVSPMYKEEGFKDGTIESYGTYYSTTTDYTNWKATNRFTCGVGYNIGKVSLDLAYQYSATNGSFSPFMNYYDNTDPAEDNIANIVDVSKKRHQVLFSLGYHF